MQKTPFLRVSVMCMHVREETVGVCVHVINLYARSWKAVLHL